jgi:uncharacterized heparinase superfamily protein
MRQAAVEIFGTPGYGLTLAWPRPTGFAAAPRDLRPVDKAVARMILAGRFVLVGAALETGKGGDPWRTPSPSRPFAVALHRFEWLPSLVAAGDRGATEALRLVVDWHQVFRDWSPFAWGREVLARRVYNLACASRRLIAAGDETTAADLADSLARQARHLLRLPDDRGWAAGHTAAAAVAGAALAGRAGEALLKRALPRLRRALTRTVLPDGCHASRNPEATLSLLFDLLTLDDALTQRGQPPGDELTRAIDRLAQAVRFFTLSDGRLCAFQGGETRDRAWPAAALAALEDCVAPEHLPDAAYHRLSGTRLTLVIDAGAPARGPFGLTACSQPLAFEAADGRDRLIVNAGWSSRETDLQGFRLEAAASTASLAEASILSPYQGRRAEALGARLDGPDFRVATARSAEDGADLLELSHDGWVRRFGLAHGRRLHLDRQTDALRGEDRFEPAPGGRARVPAVPFAIRFHLDPEVQVSRARDGKSVLLRGRSERGWWLRHDAGEAHVEPSTVFQDGAPRKTQQVVLRGVARTEAETRVRWKLSPADATRT